MARQQEYDLLKIFQQALVEPVNIAEYKIKLSYLFKLPNQFVTTVTKTLFSGENAPPEPSKSSISKFITIPHRKITSHLERQLRTLSDHADGQLNSMHRRHICRLLLSASENQAPGTEFYPGEKIEF